MTPKTIVNKDSLMCVSTLASTHKPQQLVWLAAHQDYSSDPVYLSNTAYKDEAFYGGRVLEMLLAGGKGHYGCFEHPSITFNCAYVPHSTVMQARTHRVGVTFDVQSFRYTSASILIIDNLADVEKAFYFRPIGDYTDRNGARYSYTELDRYTDKESCLQLVRLYKQKILEEKLSEEHARDCLPSNYRQHFVVSFNCRSLMHFLDLRAKADAQLEIQWLCDLLLEQALLWMPETFSWYWQKRWKKAKLSP